MITLNVFFVSNNDLGTAVMIENLITNGVILELSSKLFIGETKSLIDKAVEQLKKRYNEVKVITHWDSINEVKESDK